MKLPLIHNTKELSNLINELGFLPFFKNSVPGFSIEECTPPELWFSDVLDGPWEWKGPVIQMSGAAYGKFFWNKTGFVSAKWFPHFANYRRDGYDFDALYDDGLVNYRDKQVFDTLEQICPVLSKDLKKKAGYSGKDGLKGFDSILTRLQMECYTIISNFEYASTKDGRKYGWGIARYTTPEQHFGEFFTRNVYQNSPEESYQKILDYLKNLLPEADEHILKRLIAN